ncbi:triple tyrosine motif-containing protein [Maribacter sp. 2307ULW6-5]|uniref:helix-turn-helix and ligand-binding sensor domain-containing protein n=1 Tax=Maribacter sp. 2307ULW6-5 TaxID=3386275 RepID=UPI0039BC9D27
MGENQNWAIAQGGNGHIYVANNHALLTFNGAEWHQYPSPNNSVIRSVHVRGNKVFTGHYMQFGYWERDAVGQLAYRSISDDLKVPMLEDEAFWNIISVDDWVLFQSLDRIYSYHIGSGEFKVMEAKTSKAHIFKIDGAVFFQDDAVGLVQIEDGKPKTAISKQALGNNGVVGMYASAKGTVLILDNGEFLGYANGEAATWSIAAAPDLVDVNVYTTAQLSDGSFVLGTIANGLIQIDAQGNLVRKVNRKNGLQNNTVLATFQDRDDNLWLGLDHGIALLNMNSPFYEYVDGSGNLGVVYAAARHQNRLYLGTNQGLFMMGRSNEAKFSLVKGTRGQVWSLNVIDGTLFCGHNKGTFAVANGEASLISSFPGTWDIKVVNNRPNLLLQGNFNGLSTLKKENGRWGFGNVISGFDISSRFFELTGPNEIVVNHELKGLFQLSLDEDFTRVQQMATHPQMGYSSSLAQYDGKLRYTTVEGAFVKRADSLAFAPDSVLTDLLFKKSGGITSIVLGDRSMDALWYFTEGGLSKVFPDQFSGTLGVTTVPIPPFFKRSLGVAGFENMTHLQGNKYLFGANNGFVTLNLDALEPVSYAIGIDGVGSSLGNTAQSLPLPLSEEASLPYRAQTTLSFSFSVPAFEKYREVLYQYRLQGLSPDWGPWSTEPRADFNNLDHGNYLFQVRAKVGNTLTNNVASFKFVIAKPWYLSVWAIIGYLLLLLLLGALVHRSYKRYYTNKQNARLNEEIKIQRRKQLLAEKELIEIKNEKLNAEIEGKNRELAVATMSLIKKNEFLASVKKELSDSTNAQQVKRVVRTIDRNISNEDDWKFFEKAFNNADKDFLQNIKEAHPELTPNDLKLCAYLRLNLPSKEIAPLLNISVKSVEVKRYRLRKKMDLPREMGLTKYIMDL